MLQGLNKEAQEVHDEFQGNVKFNKTRRINCEKTRRSLRKQRIRVKRNWSEV